MSILKKIFRKATKTASIEDFSPEMQLKIEQSRISHNLAVKIDESLNEKFEIKDLRITCSVSEQVVIGIDGFVKDEQTKQGVEKHLLDSGADRVLNNLQIEY